MSDNNQLMKAEDRLANQAGVPPSANMRALSMAQVRDVGQVMAMSGMFPDIQKDGAKAFVKILAGQEMGIAPFEAMGGISIIQGKATIGGNIMAAKVKGSGKYDYKIKERTNTGCSIEFFERNAQGALESIGVEIFDESDAKAAGLYGKDMWKKYPKNMYFNRCISNGVRTYCPDVLGAGPVYTPEEMGAQVDEEGNAIVVPGVTYSQNAPGPLPAIAPPVTTDDAPQDKPIKREGNPLQLISDVMTEKGITDKIVRGEIALAVANVDDFSDLDKKQWFDVYDIITAMDVTQLESYLLSDEDNQDTEPEPSSKPDEVVEVSDDDDPAALLEAVDAPEPPKPKAAAKSKRAITKPNPSQIAKLNSLYVKEGFKDDEQKKSFNNSVIQKNFAITAEDYDALIDVLGRSAEAPNS